MSAPSIIPEFTFKGAPIVLSESYRGHDIIITEFRPTAYDLAKYYFYIRKDLEVISDNTKSIGYDNYDQAMDWAKFLVDNVHATD